MDQMRAMAVFVAVADAGGFAAAGRVLGLSAPSVTRTVADLEAKLSVRLFHRTTRLVKLSDVGERYLQDCRRILADLEGAERQARGLHGEPGGWVSLTGSAMFGRLVLTPLIFDLMDAYPMLSVSTLYVDRVVHMQEEGIDVSVRIAHLPDSSLTAIKVGTVRRVLCASPAYIEARKLLLSLDDLADHDCIDFSPMMTSEAWSFEENGRAMQRRIETRYRVNTGDAAIAAAVDGRGVGRVLSYMIADHVTSGALRIVLPDFEVPPIPVHVVHKEAGYTTARVRAVVDHLVTGLRRSPALDHNAV